MRTGCDTSPSGNSYAVDAAAHLDSNCPHVCSNIYGYSNVYSCPCIYAHVYTDQRPASRIERALPGFTFCSKWEMGCPSRSQKIACGQYRDAHTYLDATLRI